MPIPLWGPETQISVLMPPCEPENISVWDSISRDADKPARRKPAKQFRVPGERGQTVLTGGHFIASDDGRTATLHSRGQTLTPGLSEDGAAAMAEGLLSEGILREADWCGSLEKSLRRGLSRWVNEEKGAAGWRFLGNPLSLVYTDDAPAYSTGCLVHRWADHIHARPDRPIGFFGLRFQSAPRAVHVRDMTMRLESAWPGLGYGLLEHLQAAFVCSVAGYTPHWGKQIARLWGQLDAIDLLGEDLGQDTISLKAFHRSIPHAACTTGFRLEQVQTAAAEAPRTHPDLLPILEASLALFAACRRSGLTFYTLNHCRFLSWKMSISVRGAGENWGRLEQLERAPVVYTVWDPQDDIMTRMVDQFTEFARSTWQYTDLTWMHCFQLGFAGREPEDARRQLEARERAVKKVLRKSPGALSFYDPDYVAKPLPDGSLRHACEALDIVMDILGALDKVLCLLHTPETLLEQARQEEWHVAA